MRSILSKALDSEGNTKLVNKSYAGSYRLVAIHENKEIDLHYSIIGQNNWIVSYDSGKKLYHSGEDKSARIRWEYHAEVIDGVGWLTHGLYSAYPSKYSSEEPKEGPSYYFAYRFSIETGRIYQGIGIDDNNNFVFNYVDAGYTLDTQGINGPEKISVKHADWDSPSDDTSGSYLDFRNLFQHIIEPNSSKTVDNKSYIGEFKDYKFYNKSSGNYEIKLDAGVDPITGIKTLIFSDKSINVDDDIKGVFDQVTGLNTDSGKMFRLYNAAFARFPDADGLKYWIGNFSSGKDDERAVSTSFLASAEFKERYGENITHETYVQNLYLNVLNRELDQGGYDYWVGNLNNVIEQRHEVLLGFSESAENKTLFTEMTGFG